MTFLQDLKFAARLLRRSPGFTAVALLVLAVGIGANTAIFSVVNGVLLQPLPYHDPGQLVSVQPTQRGQVEPGDSVSYPDFADWQRDARSFSAMGAWANGRMTLTGPGGARSVPTALVSAHLLSLLGVVPARGRLLTPADETKGAALVAVISHDFWQRSLHGDADVVGRTLTLDGRQVTVVGVLPAGFHFPLQPKPVQIWAPFIAQHMAGQMLPQRGADFLEAIARLKPGVTVQAASAEMTALAARLAAAHPADDAGQGLQLTPYRDQLVHGVRPALLLLLGAVAFVLLIACANLATLLLARSAVRQREMALRAALGAGRGRLLRQLVTEGLLLALLGGALGLLVAEWGLQGLKALSPITVPRLQSAVLDGRVLLFTLAATLVTGLLFSVVPALQLSRARTGETLKDTSGRTASGGPHAARARTFLVTAEIALAIVLLIGAGLLVRSFAALSHVDPGFQAPGVLSLDLSLPRARYPMTQILTFSDQLLTSLRARPSIRDAAIASTLPLSGHGVVLSFTLDDRAPLPPGEQLSAPLFSVSPGYFRTMGIPLVHGRVFNDRDNRTGPRVLVINQAMAQKYWPGQNPIGQRVTIGYSSSGKPKPREIVGVVGNVKTRELSEAATPQFYTPFAQTPWPFLTAIVRARGATAPAASALRAAVQGLDRQLPVATVTSLDAYLSRSVSQPRFSAQLLGLFALTALLLAAIGVYGVMAFLVAERTREIGIRVALGASAGDIFRLVIGRGMATTMAGVAIGLVAALGVTRLLAGLLYGVTPMDPTTFVTAAFVFAVVALLACYLPARRALRVDPTEALRSE